MAHREHDGLEGAGGKRVGEAQAIFVQRRILVGNGIVDRHVDEAFELAHEIGHLGVARVGAILLEGEPHHQDPGVVHFDLGAQHRLDDVASDEARHAVIDAAAGQDHLGMEADRLRLVGQVVRIDADAVAADEARPVGMEIPFGGGGRQDLACVEAEILEQHGELVDQRDIHIALDVLDHLRGFRDADRAHLVGAGRHHAPIDAIDEVGRLGRGAGGHLDDAGQPVLEVAGIDALGRIAGEEIAVVGEAGGALQNGNADFLRGAGIDR